MTKPIGMVNMSSSDPYERIASSIWLTQQITGRRAADNTYRRLLTMEKLEPSDENIAKVRTLVGA